MRMIFSAFLCFMSVALVTAPASAQFKNDFLAAPVVTGSTVPAASNFFGVITSHDGTYVLGKSTRVMASTVKNGARVPDGVVRPVAIDWGFRDYEADFLGSQTPENINRVYLKQTIVNCSVCYTIHLTPETPSDRLPNEHWQLRVVPDTDRQGKSWDGLYLSGKEVNSAAGYTKFLAPGTPVWTRMTADQGASGPSFEDQYRPLVLVESSPGADTWHIGELKRDGTFTGKILSRVSGFNPTYTYQDMIQSSDWASYRLVDKSGADPRMTQFQLRQPVGLVTTVPIQNPGNSPIEPMYNLDTMITLEKADAFSGLAGVAFNLNAKPITSLGQRETYPGYVAFLPQIPERIGMKTKDGDFLYPRSYFGSFGAMVFAIRGAESGSGNCTQRGLVKSPVTDGFSVFPEDLASETGNWIVCILPVNWKTGERYMLRLWTIGATKPKEQRKWGAWISKPDGTDSTFIGDITIPESRFGTKAPLIASASGFVYLDGTIGCDQAAGMSVKIDGLVAEAGTKTDLSLGSPRVENCTAQAVSTACNGQSCSFGLK